MSQRLLITPKGECLIDPAGSYTHKLIAIVSTEWEMVVMESHYQLRSYFHWIALGRGKEVFVAICFALILIFGLFLLVFPSNRKVHNTVSVRYVFAASYSLLVLSIKNFIFFFHCTMFMKLSGHLQKQFCIQEIMSGLTHCYF